MPGRWRGRAAESADRRPRAAEPGPYPRFLLAVTLTEDRVVDRYGEHVGRIERLVIDADAGAVVYALVVLDTVEPGERLVAVPWRVIRPDPEHRRFVLRGEKASLQRIPPLGPGTWPATDVPEP